MYLKKGLNRNHHRFTLDRSYRLGYHTRSYSSYKLKLEYFQYSLQKNIINATIHGEYHLSLESTFVVLVLIEEDENL